MNCRKSNIELLRVISIMLIIVFHCAYKSGFVFDSYFSFNKLVIKTFMMFGELGVNLFILITGYFMVKSEFRIKKLILLLVEVMFYHWITIGFACKIGVYTIAGWKNIILSLFPITLNWYWFITVYIIIYIFSPYLNILANTLDRKMYKLFLITALVIYSVIPTIFGVFYNGTEGLLYYNRLIWMTIVYFIGAYIRLHGIKN